jgi:L-fuconate dehydratase
MATITRVETFDVRFATSAAAVGSDAMHPDPDYSAAYVVLHTDGAFSGHGMTFTIGRGNELCVAAIDALGRHLLGADTDRLFADMGGLWRTLAGDSQLRWLGPEKGVIHLATAALVNAAWDLMAKSRGVPLWQLLTEMPAEDLVACVDFRYITDALSPAEAVELLRRGEAGRAERLADLEAVGFPSYTTSVGWLGYPDAQIETLCRDAMARGWSAFKLKVGADVDDDRRRAKLVRRLIGPQGVLMMDANQRWTVDEAVEWIQALAEFDPYWMEEPTSPDDILGYAAIARKVAPVRLASGEHVHNRVMFKQLFQADAIGFCQLDTCRLGGINEVIAVLLLAAKFGVPVCPHSGGVGLSEYGQHLSMFDYLRVSGDRTGRYLEYVDHLHEHFVAPVVMRNGHYQVPRAPGSSIEMRPGTLERHAVRTR